MQPPAPPSRPGRPRDLEKGRAILQAGWALFLERGVEATPIEAIAARAGVSKVTLYSHYPDKTTLFRAAVRHEMDRIEAAQALARNPDIAMPIAVRLGAFGMGLMEFLLSKPAIDFYSAVAGELRRHEELARAFYALGPGQTLQNLTSLITAATQAGELAVSDAPAAAEELFGLWQGATNYRISLGVDVGAVRQDLHARVERGVAVFLRAYAARPFSQVSQSGMRSDGII